MIDQLADIAGDISRLISIDPGSRRAGFAVLDLHENRVESATLVSSNLKDATSRLRMIGVQIDDLFSSETMAYGKPGVCLEPGCAVVIEVPSPSGTGKTRPGTMGYGLTTYGRSVGRIEAIAEGWVCSAAYVVTIDERTWTDRRSKRSRAAMVAALVPGYDVDKDPGLDVADAIGLGLWAADRLRAASLVTDNQTEAHTAGKVNHD